MPLNITPEYILQASNNSVKLVRLNYEVIDANWKLMNEVDLVVDRLSHFIDYGTKVDFRELTAGFYSKMNRVTATASEESKYILRIARYKIDNLRTKIARNEDYERRLLLGFVDAYLVAAAEHFSTILNLQLETIHLIEGIVSRTGKLIGMSGIEDMEDANMDKVQRVIDEVSDYEQRLRKMTRNIDGQGAIVQA